ncbi:MAG: hypothetical protein KatS3mg129_1211 [Leptospiraceae bacterium]|nr:MAG: hypothetical protein KatS3mg129_1211 [Leptospiraceae bacterium]
MPFHRDSAKQIEQLVKNYKHNELDKVQNRSLYDKYFQLFMKKNEKNIKNVLDYLYTVDGIIPFFLKGLLGEAPKFQFQDYNSYVSSISSKLNDQEIYGSLYNLFELSKEEFEANKNDFYIIYKNINYFENNLNVVLDIVFERLAKNASVLPDFIIAKIASMALTPYMCANIVRFMPEKQIISLMKHFDINFLTEVVNELDPQLVQKLMPAIEQKQVEEIFKIMLQKGYFQKIANIFEHFNGNLDSYKQALKKQVTSPEIAQEIINKVSPYFVNEAKKQEFIQFVNA